jgi:hypothetical protein
MKRVWIVCTVVVLSMALACSKVEQQADRGSVGTTGESPDAPVAKAHTLTVMHGGTSILTEGHYFETVYLPDGIRVYIYNSEGTHVSPVGMTGQVVIQPTDTAAGPTALELAYIPAPEVEMGNELLMAHDYLFTPMDLTGTEAGSFRAGFAVAGSDLKAQFEGAFASLTERPFFCPMHPDAWGETTESLCPICGGMKTSAERVAK